MLSILIPIFNFDVRPFVKQLADQATLLEFETEIICLDDASEQRFQEFNAEIKGYNNVQFLRSDVNLGRSAIRNALVQSARFDNLLFLDCDGLCVSDDYLKSYTQHWDQYDVIYGGRVYDEEAPDDHDLYFHWYCGSNREAILVEQRNANPFKSFMTNNFLVKRSVYDQIKMDESVQGYGHEDTLFAQELKRAGFSITHIDNPIEHIGVESFDEFIRKSENGIRNLSILIEQGRVDATIRLVKYYNLLNSIGLLSLVASIVKKLEPRIMRNLKGPAPNLLWFDLWKLSKLHYYK